MIDRFGLEGRGWARFSDDERMRYRLARSLTGAPLEVHGGLIYGQKSAVFVMLNPSTANEFQLDPTVRRTVNFATAWGCDVLEVVNIFALRATNPRELYKLPVRERGDDTENDREIGLAVARAKPLVVCAWGAHGALDGRADAVLRQLRGSALTIHHLGLTKGTRSNSRRYPRHPLYLRADTAPIVML